jgi:hypothetical protein
MILPLVRGLYLAERVDVDPNTHNLTLVECFRTIRVERLPSAAAPFFVIAYLATRCGLAARSSPRLRFEFDWHSEVKS